MAQEEKPTTFIKEAEEMLMKEMITQFLPKIKKYAGPMRDKLFKFLEDNKKCLHIRIAGDEIYLLVIDNDKITAFDVEDDGYATFPVDQFLPMLVSGDLEALMNATSE